MFLSHSMIMNYKVEFNEEKQKGFQTGDASDVES